MEIIIFSSSFSYLITLASKRDFNALVSFSSFGIYSACSYVSRVFSNHFYQVFVDKQIFLQLFPEHIIETTSPGFHGSYKLNTAHKIRNICQYMTIPLLFLHLVIQWHAIINK